MLINYHKLIIILYISLGGVGNMQKFEYTFGGFCGQYLGNLGPKTLNIWGSIMYVNIHPRSLNLFSTFSTIV